MEDIWFSFDLFIHEMIINAFSRCEPVNTTECYNLIVPRFTLFLALRSIGALHKSQFILLCMCILLVSVIRIIIGTILTIANTVFISNIAVLSVHPIKS